MKVVYLLLVGMTVALITSLSIAGDETIRVQDPWIREAPPVAKVLAAYMRIENQGSSVQVLAGASSPSFQDVMLHGTEIRDGIAQMYHLDQVEIPPGGSAVFEPEGNHFMLMGLKQPLRAGDQAVLNLHFEGGDSISVTAAVRKVGADATMQH